MSQEPQDDTLEEFFAKQFAEAEAQEDTPNDLHQSLDRIEERACFESTLKQSTSFFFSGFSVILTNMVASLCGNIPPNDSSQNYKP